MKLKVGEYIRTEVGIAKIIGIDDNCYIIDRELPIDDEWAIYEGSILKHSFNLVNILEVGDYVNGERISSIKLDPFILNQINLWIDRWEHDNSGGMYRVKYLDKDIKSIVTKEQFENMSYKVGE